MTAIWRQSASGYQRLEPVELAGEAELHALVSSAPSSSLPPACPSSRATESRSAVCSASSRGSSLGRLSTRLGL
jgi:hypothetical protein